MISIKHFKFENQITSSLELLYVKSSENQLVASRKMSTPGLTTLAHLSTRNNVHYYFFFFNKRNAKDRTFFASTHMTMVDGATSLSLRSIIDTIFIIEDDYMRLPHYVRRKGHNFTISTSSYLAQTVFSSMVFQIFFCTSRFIHCSNPKDIISPWLFILISSS